MKVRPISVTQALPGAIPDLPPSHTPEAVIVYTARVSAPENQTKHLTGPRLLAYCMRHGHWSVFEMVDLTMEIETSRAIAAQILRHRSFSFQEFSQRYSDVSKLGDLFEVPELREKHVEGNRQGSGGDASQLEVPWEMPRSIWRRTWDRIAKAFGLPWLSAVESPPDTRTAQEIMQDVLDHSSKAYTALIQAGVAPECSRMVLPLCTRTRIYMKGSVRSWIHYFNVRCDGHAQKEHRLVAEAIKAEFAKIFPVIAEAIAPEEPTQP